MARVEAGQGVTGSAAGAMAVAGLVAAVWQLGAAPAEAAAKQP